MNFVFIVFTCFICIFPEFVKLESKRCKSKGTSEGLPDGCEMNDSGYLCCSGALQETIMEAIDELKKEKEETGEEFDSCNMHAMGMKIGVSF
uniref:Uncharacterized protein n=1 Tax=Panagrolaimus sp. PS1159 TaxID=55785 RepID=A0AC35GC13_9BILA